MIRYNRTKRGLGIVDWLKPVMSLVNKTVENKDVGENTKDIIKEIKALHGNNETASIVNRINELRQQQRSVGFGFAYI